jgi:hypothetical protein
MYSKCTLYNCLASTSRWNDFFCTKRQLQLCGDLQGYRDASIICGGKRMPGQATTTVSVQECAGNVNHA